MRAGASYLPPEFFSNTESLKRRIGDDENEVVVQFLIISQKTCLIGP